ncbi:hypothetical protein QR97_13300 [Streptomyces sp. PBH53]|nr:hypothetical protein QR97_13300 [Streptomyces sp. PBH53]
MRREIYVRLMTAKDEAHSHINKVWVEKPAPVAESALHELYHHADQVGAAYTLISLEGPPAVAEAAEAIFKQVREEVYLVLSLLGNSVGSRSIYEAHQARYRQAVADRPAVERAFVEAARVVLGGNLAEPE